MLRSAVRPSSQDATYGKPRSIISNTSVQIYKPTDDTIHKDTGGFLENIFRKKEKSNAELNTVQRSVKGLWQISGALFRYVDSWLA